MVRRQSFNLDFHKSFIMDVLYFGWSQRVFNFHISCKRITDHAIFVPKKRSTKPTICIIEITRIRTFLIILVYNLVLFFFLSDTNSENFNSFVIWCSFDFFLFYTYRSMDFPLDCSSSIDLLIVKISINFDHWILNEELYQKKKFEHLSFLKMPFSIVEVIFRVPIVFTTKLLYYFFKFVKTMDFIF